MSDTYKFKRVEIRRVIEEACQDVIRDKKIAEQLYMKIMMPLEDFLSDCKYEPMTEPTISKMEQVDKDTNVRSKPNDCEYAENPSGDVWECGCFLDTYCEHQIYDRNPDGTLNIVECGFEPKTEPQPFDKPPKCLGCLHSDLDKAFHPCASCVDFGKYVGEVSGKDEPQTERSE